MNKNGRILLVEIPIIWLLNVDIPATSRIFVLTFAVPRPESAEPSPSYFVAVMTPV